MKTAYISTYRMAMCALPIALAILSGCTDEPPVGADTEEVQAGNAEARLKALKASVKGTEIPQVTDYGKSIALTEYPKGTKVEKILADVTGWNEEDFADDTFSSATGARAVDVMAIALEDEAKRLLEDDGEEDAQKASAALTKVASDARAYFTPTQFTSIVTKEHGIEEDGDLESHTLIATNRDGSLLVLSYTDFPF